MGFRNIQANDDHLAKTDIRQRFATVQVRKMIENASGMVGTGFFGMTADDAKSRISGFGKDALPNGWQLASVSKNGQATEWVGVPSAIRIACLAAVRDWRVPALRSDGSKFLRRQTHKGDVGHNGAKAKSRMRFLGVVDGFQHNDQLMLITSGSAASLSIAFQKVYRQFIADIKKATKATGDELPIYYFWMPVALDNKLTPPPGGQGQPMQLPIPGWDRTAIEGNNVDGMNALLNSLYVGDEQVKRLQAKWEEAQAWKKEQEAPAENSQAGANGAAGAAGGDGANDALPWPGSSNGAAPSQLSPPEKAVFSNANSFVGAVVSASGGVVTAQQVQETISAQYGGNVAADGKERVAQFRAVLGHLANPQPVVGQPPAEEDQIPF